MRRLPSPTGPTTPFSTVATATLTDWKRALGLAEDAEALQVARPGKGDGCGEDLEFVVGGGQGRDGGHGEERDQRDRAEHDEPPGRQGGTARAVVR